jgi:ABC-type phosphate transport system ATPase subunit
VGGRIEIVYSSQINKNMAFQTRDEAQDKVSRKLDRVLNKKKKQVPLNQESWDDLNRRGATLAEQEQWIVLRRRQKERDMNNKA